MNIPKLIFAKQEMYTIRKNFCKPMDQYSKSKYIWIDLLRFSILSYLVFNLRGITCAIFIVITGAWMILKSYQIKWCECFSALI